MAEILMVSLVVTTAVAWNMPRQVRKLSRSFSWKGRANRSEERLRCCFGFDFRQATGTRAMPVA